MVSIFIVVVLCLTTIILYLFRKIASCHFYNISATINLYQPLMFFFFFELNKTKMTSCYSTTKAHCQLKPLPEQNILVPVRSVVLLCIISIHFLIETPDQLHTIVQYRSSASNNVCVKHQNAENVIYVTSNMAWL